MYEIILPFTTILFNNANKARNHSQTKIYTMYIIEATYYSEIVYTSYGL